MGNEIITPAGTDAATIMTRALAPYSLRERWCEYFTAAYDAMEFVRIDRDGELVALGDDVDWPVSKAMAVAILSKLPSIAEIAANRKALDQAVTVKPPSADYQLLASKMLLGVLGIKGENSVDSYLEMLALTMEDVWLEKSDPRGTPRWIPVPAFAKAIRATLADRASWETYGGTRRPPIPDILGRCKEGRSKLMSIWREVEMLAETRERLETIVRVVSGYEEDEYAFG